MPLGKNQRKILEILDENRDSHTATELCDLIQVPKTSRPNVFSGLKKMGEHNLVAVTARENDGSRPVNEYAITDKGVDALAADDEDSESSEG